ncbi:hypothetical protein DUNSADRAFT_5510 [Dunaliella salina]|uniref:SET domain-containing protein n=1 Tax=Dunaliella salina TaxID=3046 RepID=A0ABQ7H7C8_DUNSA|nr:hypothetical protein DUNSADRAFT_5510 [Dunaliella salina]|eukprot:KAF5842744.1 hypothetical protein DUNSADRAFT_5510 [Dunaliella salina]
MLHSSCTPCCFPGTRMLLPRTATTSPSLASHLQCAASPALRPRFADAVLTSTFLASNSRPAHQPAALHASNLNENGSSTGILMQADQQQQQQQPSQPPKKRGRKPKHASVDVKAEMQPGPKVSQGRQRAGRRTSEPGAAGIDGKKKRLPRSARRSNSVAADTLSNDGRTQPSDEHADQAHNIPVIPLPPPPEHAAASAGPGFEEGSGHRGGSAAHKLAAAADAARLSFGLPTKRWSARRQRRALERGRLPWGMSPCLQDEQLLNKAMQLVYSGGPKEGSSDDPALANVGWGNRISVRTSEGSGTVGRGTASNSSSSSNVGHAPSSGSRNSSSGSSREEGLTAAGNMLPCPPRFIGPVEVKPITGKGWGLVATDIIEPGEAVLVSEPLIAACSMQSGQPPSPLVLLPWLQRLQRELPEEHPARVALHALWHGKVQGDANGSSSSSSSSSSSRSERGITRASSRRDGVMGEGKKSSRSDGRGRAGRALVRVPDIVSWEVAPEDEEEGWQEEEEEKGQEHDKAFGRGQGSRNGAFRSSEGADGKVKGSDEGARGEDLGEAELQGLLLHNVFGDRSEDPAAALCRGDGSHALIGIWPEFSLINHACLPNAAHVLLGGRMVVRAIAPIMPNQEITVNYLGHAALAPYVSRQEELQGIHGFSCTCARCRVELSLLRELGGTLEEVCVESAMLQGELQEVVPHIQQMGRQQGLQQRRQQQEHAEAKHQHGAADDGGGVQGGQHLSWAAVHEHLQELHSAAVVLRQHLLQKVGRVATLEASHPHKRLYVLAAAFDVYNTLFDIRQVLAAHATAIPSPEASTSGPPRPVAPGPHFSLGSVEVLQQMVELVEVCLPGSDLHTLLSAQLAQQSALRYGVSDSRMLSAECTCVNGHMLRYGPCTTPVIDGLVDAGLEVLARASPFHLSALQAVGAAPDTADAPAAAAAADKDAADAPAPAAAAADKDDDGGGTVDGTKGRTKADPHDPAVELHDGTQPLSQDGMQPLTRDVAQSLPQDGMQSLPQDGMEPLSQDGAQPLSRDVAQSLPQDGTQPPPRDGMQPPPGVVVLLPSWLRDARDPEASRGRSSMRSFRRGPPGASAKGASGQGAARDASLDTMLEGLLLQPIVGALPSSDPASNNLRTSRSARGSETQYHRQRQQQQAEDEQDDEEDEEEEDRIKEQDDWKKLWRA